MAPIAGSPTFAPSFAATVWSRKSTGSEPASFSVSKPSSFPKSSFPLFGSPAFAPSLALTSSARKSTAPEFASTSVSKPNSLVKSSPCDIIRPFPPNFIVRTSVPTLMVCRLRTSFNIPKPPRVSITGKRLSAMPSASPHAVLAAELERASASGEPPALDRASFNQWGGACHELWEAGRIEATEFAARLLNQKFPEQPYPRTLVAYFDAMPRHLPAPLAFCRRSDRRDSDCATAGLRKASTVLLCRQWHPRSAALISSINGLAGCRQVWSTSRIFVTSAAVVDFRRSVLIGRPPSRPSGA